jgi:hypothetical protein
MRPMSMTTQDTGISSARNLKNVLGPIHPDFVPEAVPRKEVRIKIAIDGCDWLSTAWEAGILPAELLPLAIRFKYRRIIGFTTRVFSRESRNPDSTTGIDTPLFPTSSPQLAGRQTENGQQEAVVSPGAGTANSPPLSLHVIDLLESLSLE